MDIANEHFILHKNFSTKPKILENPKFILLLEPIQELHWLIFVPKISNAKNILDLEESDFTFCNFCVRKIAKQLNDRFQATQVNIATLGNITQQLHFHIILRYNSDKFWPKAPFDETKTPLSENEVNSKIKIYRELFADAL
jgi:diadenosine tetraphosphate (Ap4A) HIT family hydrolase